MPFYLTWVYGKGQTFLEKLHTNSLPLHMVVLENTTLFFGTFRKGNVNPWERCGKFMTAFETWPIWPFKCQKIINKCSSDVIYCTYIGKEEVNKSIIFLLKKFISIETWPYFIFNKNWPFKILTFFSYRLPTYFLVLKIAI